MRYWTLWMGAAVLTLAASGRPKPARAAAPHTQPAPMAAPNTPNLPKQTPSAAVATTAPDAHGHVRAV
jgi:hypothetical protein